MGLKWNKWSWPLTPEPFLPCLATLGRPRAG